MSDAAGVTESADRIGMNFALGAMFQRARSAQSCFVVAVCRML